MGMVVRSNMAAINASNNLNKNNSTVGKSMEKLASGFKINKAADNASGLAISEKMKAQIKSLDTASANCEDGASLIQTAEGYLTEAHDMLNRMVELAEKSANGTMEATTSSFAGSAAYSATNTEVAGTDRAALQAEMDQLCAEIDRIAKTANFNSNKLFNGSLQSGYTGNSGSTGTALTLQIGETSTKADKLSVDIKSLKTNDLLKGLQSAVNADSSISGDITVSNQLAVSSSNVSGITVNISDQKFASLAAESLRTVINTVSSQRANLGAMQNRLEYTVNNLDTASENMSAANSRIRDTDMAKEMMKYTQGNVLTQAAQAMLAQANTQPQNVLQLLQ